ncbi:receptor expression-enhancing protein [Pycnococcus provasolii]
MVLPSLVARLLITLLGVVYPSYECFKSIAKIEGASSQQTADVLKRWCMFWIVFGCFVALEPVADSLIFWLPLYYEVKVAFVVYLWHPRTQGATFVYDSFIQPTLLHYEYEIDQKLDALTSKGQQLFQNYSAYGIKWAQRRAVDLFSYIQQSQQAGGRVGANAQGAAGGVNYSAPQTAAQAATNAFGSRAHAE